MRHPRRSTGGSGGGARKAAASARRGTRQETSRETRRVPEERKAALQRASVAEHSRHRVWVDQESRGVPRRSFDASGERQRRAGCSGRESRAGGNGFSDEQEHARRGGNPHRFRRAGRGRQRQGGFRVPASECRFLEKEAQEKTVPQERSSLC